MLNFALLFFDITNVNSVIIFCLLGFILLDKKIFGLCLYLLMITVIYNALLKNIFKIPLPETCPSDGYGFPSGHMHFISIFYLWIIFYYKNIFLRILCILTIIYNGYLTVKLGYHYPHDIIAAFIFALISVFLYSIFTNFVKDLKYISLFSILIATTLLITLRFYAEIKYSYINSSFCFLIGFAIFWNLLLIIKAKKQ